MNSEVISPTLSSATPIHTSRPILIITAIYVALLVGIGMMMRAENRDDWFLPLSAAFVPALVYATGTFVYGRTLFGNTESEARARAWVSLIWITAFLYAAVVIITGPWRAPSLRDLYFPIGTGLIAAITIVLLVLWARIGSTVFVRQQPSSLKTNPESVPTLGISFLVGAAMMLCSLALGVDYFGNAYTGWSVLIGDNWSSGEFIRDTFSPWPGGLIQAGYAVGILFGLLTLIAGVMTVSRILLPSKSVSILLNVSLILFWLTLTTYYFDAFFLALVGIFGGLLETLTLTGAWLTMFVLGTVLWFKYRNRADGRGRNIRTAVMLWALPLIPFTIATFWIVLDYLLYGMVLYIAGLQIVTACWWKAWSTRPDSLPV